MAEYSAGRKITVKNSVLALIVMSAIASVARAAEGSIELYAILDDSFAHIEHSLPTSDVHTFGFNSFNVPGQNQGSRWAVVSGAEQMSRYGLQGEETFSDGVSGFFKLEGAMNTATGQIANNGRSVLNNANTLSTISSASSINGQAFSRAQYIGISYPLFGSIQVGRTVAFSTEQSSEFDPLHASGLYSPIGYSGTIGGGLGITENGRFDNSIRYDNKIGDVSFGLQYKIGQTDSSEAADVGSALEGMVAYRGGPLSVELAASETRNTPALSYKLFTNDVGLRVSNTFGFMLGAKYDLTPKAAIYAGVEHTDQTIPSSSNSWSTQITSYYAMPIAGLVTAKAFASSWGDAPIRVLWVGADYQFTDSFSLNVGYYNVNNEANSHNDQYTNQQFAILPDYKFDEHFDVYAGVMIAHYTGAYLTQFSPITVATGNVLYGIGLRVKVGARFKA
jgi:general bacterial porin, GBP family